MSKKRSSLESLRKKAYALQSGRCFYCGSPMWQHNPEQFAARHKLTLKQTKLLKCTGEHLTAHSERGQASTENIVAACWYCNSHRHKTLKPRSPDSYRDHVRKSISKGCWHQLQAFKDSHVDQAMKAS